MGTKQGERQTVATMGRLRTKVALGLLLALVAVLVAGCASGARSAYQKAEQAAEREMWDHAVLAYAKAKALDPDNERYKVALARAKLRAATAHFDRAKRYLKNEQLELAIEELQETVILDPSNQYALNELEDALRRLEQKRSGPSEVDKARAQAAQQARQLGPPKLDPVSNIPIVLNYPDSTVEEVYNALSKASGINFLYDEKLDLQRKTSVELSNVTFEKAMDLLMLMHKHFYKVIDSHTILIAEDSRQKRSEYEDQVIRTFYLSNAETKEVQTLVRSLLETRRISENKELNAITIKDNPETIKIAERIIKANDKAKGEVIVDMELLEINRNELQRLGIDLSNKSLSLVFGEGDESLTLNSLDVIKSEAAWSIGPIPSVLLNFLKTDSDARTLSRPQLRILEGEEGKITIGDRVPIPATTFNTSQTVGGNIVPVTSFTYQNVGIIVSVEPRVHHNKEITLKLSVEISALAGSVEGSGGVSQPIIGTRTVETTIRLQDGETNLLAGLIREEERSSMSGIPGLSDIPFLRRIFGVNETDKSKTDIVLSVTPHIIRVPNIQPIDLVPLWVGTEERIQLRGVARNALGESPFAGPSPWEEIDQELNGEDEARSGDSPSQVDMRSEGGEDQAAGAEGEARGERPRRRPRSGAGEEPARQPGSESGERSRRGEGGEMAPFGEEPLPEGEQPEAPSLEDAEASDEEPGSLEPSFSVAQLRLAPGRTQVAAGDTVRVQMLVSGAEEVGTVNFQLRYDPSVLRFVPPAEPGGFVQVGGRMGEVQAVESAEGGLVVVSALVPGQEGGSGSGTLATLNFVALEAGSSGFAFSGAQVRSANGDAQPASFRVSNVNVVE
jgi:general secretion pathway protein D